MRLADEVLFLEPNGWNPILKLIERFSRHHVEHEERSFFLGTYECGIRAGGGRIERVVFSRLVPFFCPDWFVPIGALLEPVIQRIPFLRRFSCGQVGIVARGRGRLGSDAEPRRLASPAPDDRA